MTKQEDDQNIIILTSKIFVDFLDGLMKQYDLPDSIAATINFCGREMQKVVDGTRTIDWSKLKRKSNFSEYDLSKFMISLITHALQMGRYINKIRSEKSLVYMDWYVRAKDEDENERKQIQSV